MTQLVSPGVQVTIINQPSVPAVAAGTVPTVFIATQTNKLLSDGITIAPGTDPVNAGKVYTITSQRELLQTFGNPFFNIVDGTVQQGDEVNEVGLHAAYSYLGLANSINVVRADLDMSQLMETEQEPTSPPANGTYWFDYSNSSFGVFRANGNAVAGLAWNQVSVLTPTASQIDGFNVPLNTFGAAGNVAVVVEDTNNAIYEKVSTTWYLIGSSAWNTAKGLGYSLFYSPNSSVPAGTHSGDIWIKTTNQNFGANYSVKLYNSSLSQFQTVAAPLYADDIKAEIGGGVAINRLYVEYNTIAPAPSANGVIKRLSTLAAASATTTAFASPSTGSFSIRTRGSAGSLAGTEITINVGLAGSETASAVASLINTAVATNGSIPHIVATVSLSQLVITSSNGTAFDLEEVSNTPLTDMTMPTGVFSNWVILTYTASVNAPTRDAVDGTLWFNPALVVDIMVNDGDEWKGYRNVYPTTDPNGPQVTSAEPTTQSNGNPLVDNDLWIDSNDVVNYPKIYVYRSGEWTLVDNTDQVTPLGIVFGDIRKDSGAEANASTAPWLETRTAPLSGVAQPKSILSEDLLHSDFCDPVDLQILNPQTFPAGIMLFNTRISTDNVKVRRNSYFAGVTNYSVGIFLDSNYELANPGSQADALAYLAADPARWVTFSGNDFNGVALMGRFAQRQCVIVAMAAQIVNNDAIRDEALFFNLLAAPGYVELFADLVELNVDRQETAFIITDVPATLTPDATSLQAWATNSRNVATDGRLGRITAYDYAAMYYPWGLGTNVDGNSVAIPSSTIALRTYGYNDRVGYPWTPPAGTRRGLVSNASSVGYIDINTMEYKPTNVNQGQRDTLYTNNINPILFRPGQGLVVRGDKTLSANTTGLLTRVNVARTVVYLRWILPQLFEGFLFELNTDATRAAAKDMADKFLVGLVGLGALTDFVTVCDTSNNTPTTIAANELFIDIAVVPTFAIDFIYIPVALQISLNK